MPDDRLPIRTCVGCLRRDAQAALVRVVADGAGRLKIDSPRREPGRGAWLHPERRCVEEAWRKDAFARSFRRKVLRPRDGDVDGFYRSVLEAVAEVRGTLGKPGQGNEDT